MVRGGRRRGANRRPHALFEWGGGAGSERVPARLRRPPGGALARRPSPPVAAPAGCARGSAPAPASAAPPAAPTTRGRTDWVGAGRGHPSGPPPPTSRSPAPRRPSPPPRRGPGLTRGLGRAARGADTCRRAACLRRSAAFSATRRCSSSTRSSCEGASGAAAFFSSDLGGRQGGLRNGGPTHGRMGGWALRGRLQWGRGGGWGPPSASTFLLFTPNIKKQQQNKPCLCVNCVRAWGKK